MLENAVGAAWTGAVSQLRPRFLRWAGKDQEGQRRVAFAEAAEIARRNTLRYAADPQQATQILDVLDSDPDPRGAQALAEEGAKLMLFSAAPDVPRLTTLCQERLRWDVLWAGQTSPPAETVAALLSDFLTNLREAMLDQEPYQDLIQREMLRALREVVAELRPLAYDDEATYRYQVAEMHRQLEFVGIPELKERRPITLEDVFIRLRAEREVPRSRIPEDALAQRVGKSLTGVTEEGIPPSMYEMPIEELRLSVRTYNILKRTGMIHVGDVIHRLRLGEEAMLAIRNFGRGSLTELTEQLRVLIEYYGKTIEPKELHEALRGTKRSVILGDPGTGKTTLLKYLTVICAEGRGESELGLRADGAGSPLPVFIPLREFAAECAGRDQDYCLLDYLYTHAHEHLLLNLRRGFFEEPLQAGRCLVCLDGLDEVWAVGQRKMVCDEVRALVSRFPRDRYLVTSRIVGYQEAPLDRRDFVHHTILPLEEEDIRQFVRKWYAVRERDPVHGKRRADDLIATMEREPCIKALATDPLLLTIIALVHRIEGELPHERVKLYDKCVAALVDTWERSRS